MGNAQSDIGFLFDWDGVVVDSSRQHEESWNRLSAAEGLPLYDGHFKEGFGKKNTFIIPNLLKWTQDPKEIARLSERKEVFYREIVAESGLAPLPGVRAFLDELDRLRLPRCVASSTTRENIEAVMARIGLSGRFRAIVAAEDVGRGKPDPEVFLKAADRIGVDPSRCIVFEDSYSGIEAGLAGGMKVVALATTNAAADLAETGASLVVASFQELSLAQLRGILD